MEPMKLEVPGVRELMAEVEAVKVEMRLLRDSMLSDTVSISQIAEIEGTSRSSLYGKERYLLPRFGQSGYPDGVARWSKDEYLKWRAIPASERKQMYLSHLRDEKIKTKKRK